MLSGQRVRASGGRTRALSLNREALSHLLALYGDEFTLGELVALSLSPAWPLASLCTVRGRA